MGKEQGIKMQKSDETKQEDDFEFNEQPVVADADSDDMSSKHEQMK